MISCGQPHDCLCTHWTLTSPRETKMLAHLMLAVLGLGLTTAQQEYFMYTNGMGGEKCGKYHRCIKEVAECMDREGIHMCECKDDEMYGNAKLQCVHREDKHIRIQRDPHLVDLQQKFSSLDTPCPYRVLNLWFAPEADVRVIVDLHAQNTLFKEGHYFLTKLTMSTTVYLGSDLMKQVMEFEGDIHADVDGDIYNYTLIARSLDTSLIDLPEGVESVVTKDDSRFSKYIMDVDKDFDDNLLTAEIKGLGIKLVFRPPSTQEDLNNMDLPMVPGAVFIVKGDYWKFVDESKSEYDIAAFPQGPSLVEKATELKVSKPLYVQYLMLSNSTIDIGYNDSICYRTQENFSNECKSDQDRFDMLRSCSAIYREKDFLGCLTSKHSKEEYMPLHKQLFQLCMHSLCLKDAAECADMQKQMPEITGCPLPRKLAELDCSTILEEKSPEASEDWGFF